MSSTGRSVLAGIAGGLVGSATLDVLNYAWTRATRGKPNGREQAYLHHGIRPDVEEAKDRSRCSGRMEDDASTKIADVIARPVFGRSLRAVEKQRAGQIVHYTYGAILGVCYGLLADKFPVVRSGFGTLYGAAEWMVAGNLALPALGLTQRPHRYPASQQAYAFFTHAAFGAVVEGARVLLDGNRSR